MKKILTLVILTFASTQVFAQYEYGEPVPVKSNRNLELRKTRFGLFFAPNNSWMKPTSSKSNDGLYAASGNGARIGYTWGLMMDHFFAENYAIATGLQLNTTGGKMNATYTKSDASTTAGIVRTAEFDYRLQYFEIPFGLKLLSDDLSGGLRIFGNLGITAAVNISKKATYTVTYSDTSSTSPGGIDPNRVSSGDNEKLRGGLSITPILFQMNLGGGIEYQATDKLSLYIGLFFNNGFAPDATNPKEIKMDYRGKFSDANTRLNNISLKIGMFF